MSEDSKILFTEGMSHTMTALVLGKQEQQRSSSKGSSDRVRAFSPARYQAVLAREREHVRGQVSRVHEVDLVA